MHLKQIQKEIEAVDQVKYSEWNSELFESICSETGSYLEVHLKDDKASLKAYLQLVSEGIGRGLIVNSLNPEYAEWYLEYKEWKCFLEYLLIGIVPCEITSVKPDLRIKTLVEVWNIGEGILNDEVWMDPYLLNCAGDEKPKLSNLVPFLTSLIDPIYESPGKIDWKKSKVNILDCRQISKDFLPGEMFLTAGNVVCIEDRRNKSLVGGLVFKGNEAVLISHNKLFSKSEQVSTVLIQKSINSIKLNETSVELPLIGKVGNVLVSDSGFALASTEDSQQLWVVRGK